MLSKQPDKTSLGSLGASCESERVPALPAVLLSGSAMLRVSLVPLGWQICAGCEGYLFSRNVMMMELPVPHDNGAHNSEGFS